MHELAANVFVETGFEGVNVGLIRTTKGLVSVDLPTYPQDAQTWAYRIRQLDRAPLRFILLTDPHIDRIMAGQWFNAPVISQTWTAVQLSTYLKRLPTALLERLNNAALAVSEETLLKSQISFSRRMSLLLGETQIVLEHLPGPTPGNLIVRLPQTGVIFAGDLVMEEMAERPSFPTEVDLGQWQTSLTRLIDSLTPTDKLVVGRGKIGDQATAVAFSHKLERFIHIGNDL
jgi:glyoxylase-like metal-dependent hydrolase (beta-lactamase superfamily II)